MAGAVATFGPGVNAGIPISGSLGGGSLPISASNPVSAPNIVQNSAPTSSQYAGGTLGSPVLGASTTNSTPATTTSTGPSAAQTEYDSQYAADQAAIQSGIGTSAGDYKQSILDAANSNKNAQLGINQQGIQNELSRDQGLQGVSDMVGNGIQGGGVQIDDAGAGTSSAGEALARDYGIVGRQAASQVGNQYAQGQNTVNTNQTELNNNEGVQASDLSQKKADTINNIVSSANQSLQYLDSLAASADITDLPSIQQQIATVKAQATSALSAYDSELGGVNTTQEAQPDEQAAAQGLFAAGTAPANAFNYTTTAPAQFQNTGPSPSSLPIYIAPNKNNDTGGA